MPILLICSAAINKRIMINREQAAAAFKAYLQENGYEKEDGYELKYVHTFHVCQRALEIAASLNCDESDTDLAWLIALLHDIGRFAELSVFHTFDGTRFDHAKYGADLLGRGLLRRFIVDDSYDRLILKAISNHSKLVIEDGLTPHELFHARLIRDADKLDNFRVKLETTPEETFPGYGFTNEILSTSGISDSVMESVRQRQCVKLEDRKEPLDYYVCIMAFIFDLNYPYSRSYVKMNDIIRRMIRSLNCKDEVTCGKLDEIRAIMEAYLQE